MSVFQNFKKFDLSAGEDLFNVPVRGSKFLDEGTHSVKIVSVEKDAERDILQVTFDNGKDQTMRERLFMFQPQTEKPSAQILGMLMAVFGTNAKGLQFLQAANERPILWSALTGMTLEVTVVKGERGYVVKTEGAELRLVDAGDGTTQGRIVLANLGAFEKYSDITDAVKAYNAVAAPEERLYRAYPKVKTYGRLDNGVEKNVQSLHAAITATAQTAGGNSAGFDPKQFFKSAVNA